jgi:Phage integrase family
VHALVSQRLSGGATAALALTSILRNEAIKSSAHVRRLGGFLSRTPGPPPFSSMNAMPGGNGDWVHSAENAVRELLVLSQAADCLRVFSNVTLSMLFKEIYELARIRTSSHSGKRTFATRLNAKGVGMRTIQKLMGHQNIGTTALYCDVSDETLRNAVELV